MANGSGDDYSRREPPPMPGSDDDPVLPDSPKSNLVVRDKDEASSLARKVGGQLPPDECRFHCITCGWDKTLKFDQDEIDSLGGDITQYSGPCPECGSMTLTPRDHLIGSDFKSIQDRAQANKRKDYEEQADVLVDRVKQEVGGIFGGTAAHKPGEEFGNEPEKKDEEQVPGRKSDLPESDDVDMGDLKGR